MSSKDKPAGKAGKLHASGDRNDDAYASDAPPGRSGAPRYDADYSESQGGSVADAPAAGGKKPTTAAKPPTSTKKVPPLDAPRATTATAPAARSGASPGKQGSLK